MAKTYTQILADASQHVQDTGNAIFATTEFDSLMPQGLLKVSEARPWNPAKVTKTTTIDSYDITLTAGDKWRLLTGSGYKQTGIQYAEYLVDQNPVQQRGMSRFGDTLTLEVSTRPSTAVSVYLFMNKVHLLQKTLGTTDTDLAIKTQADVGAVSLALKSAGTGTVEEMTTLTIAGDTTVYYVTAQATIAANEVTVSIWPALTAIALVDAVVTIALTESTLDYTQENLLGIWLAAQASISKATTYYGQVKKCVTIFDTASTGITALLEVIKDYIDLAVKQSGDTTSSVYLAKKAISDGSNDSALDSLADAKTEMDKIANVLAGTTTPSTTSISSLLTSGQELINSIPVGGGLNDSLSAVSGLIGEVNAIVVNYQAYLQKAATFGSIVLSDLSIAKMELEGAQGRVSEINTKLNYVASLLRVSDGGRNYEVWGRQELAKVESEIKAMIPVKHRTSYVYSRD